MKNDEIHDIGYKFPQRIAHDLSIETAKIMFHGTHQGLTAEEVIQELAKHCFNAWKTLPVQGVDYQSNP